MRGWTWWATWACGCVSEPYRLRAAVTKGPCPKHKKSRVAVVGEKPGPGQPAGEWLRRRAAREVAK